MSEKSDATQWLHARKQQLNRHPFCAECQKSGEKNESDNGRAYRSRRVRRQAVYTSNLQSLCRSCRLRKSAQEGSRGKKRGTITSPRCQCVTEPKPLILRKLFRQTPTSRKRKIIPVECKKEKFRLISALQALRVRRCVCFRR